jgi:penicillin G amidase
MTLRYIPFLLIIACLVGFNHPFLSAQTLSLKQLHDSVDVIRDTNGINHVYARNEHDLFFSQGYLAAKDRLFQFEIWRRQATGTLSEILGQRELQRDIGVRLFKFRGDKRKELNHYHPRGEDIVYAFVEGVNAYISEVRSNPKTLPIEFRVLDILPGYWTWEVVISRHQGLLENVRDELEFSRVVSLVGTEKAKQLFYFHPNTPVLDIHPDIPQELLLKDVLAAYTAFRSPIKFLPEDVIPEFRNNQTAYHELVMAYEDQYRTERHTLGSNNWVISGSKSTTGFPILANDPHRLQAIPSLRYWVHLHAPGWDVVGGGEPVIPGISIGHNSFGAWGLTIFETDMEDMRVYNIHPDNPQLYWHKGKWLNMTVIQDTISIKGEPDLLVQHFYTIHGPVTFIDSTLKKAVAVQCAWLEPGGAPYLASLSMNQARTWEEFREACTRNNVPAENMIWADKEGNIGWQATGISPIRKGFSGLVALSGGGSQEWEGYLPIAHRPNALNPAAGFIATANENVTPAEYPFQEALGYEWADPFRGQRIKEVLEQDKKFTLEEMAALQNDLVSLPARRLLHLLDRIQISDSALSKTKNLLSKWDQKLDIDAVPAAIYVMWERKIRQNIKPIVIPEKVTPYVNTIQMSRVMEWMEHPELIFGAEAETKRNDFLVQALQDAVAELEQKLGSNRSNWQYGQRKYKHTQLTHVLSAAVSPTIRSQLNTDVLPRGGYSFTLSANAYGDLSSSGASFKIVVDLSDWNRLLGINNPGQSGNPESPFYRNLFSVWANDGYFVVPFDKGPIVETAIEQHQLVPKKIHRQRKRR